jgi:hypothetical protein
METDRIARDFLARTLPKSEWTHEAHLRVGLWHALHHQEADVLNLLRERIRAYNVSTGVANTPNSGYHETVTRFYVRIIHHYLGSADCERPIDDLARELIARFGDRHLPLRHYTRERLFSPEARLGWIAPDLQPLPENAPAACSP